MITVLQLARLPNIKVFVNCFLLYIFVPHFHQVYCHKFLGKPKLILSLPFN